MSSYIEVNNDVIKAGVIKNKKLSNEELLRKIREDLNVLYCEENVKKQDSRFKINLLGYELREWVYYAFSLVLDKYDFKDNIEIEYFNNYGLIIKDLDNFKVITINYKDIMMRFQSKISQHSIKWFQKIIEKSLDDVLEKAEEN